MSNLSDACYAEMADILHEAETALYLDEIDQPVFDEIATAHFNEDLTLCKQLADNAGLPY